MGNKTHKAIVTLAIVLVTLFTTACAGGTPKEFIDDCRVNPDLVVQIGDNSQIACSDVLTQLGLDVSTPASAAATPAPTVVPAAAPVTGPYVSLNYDETGGDPLTPGQTKLLALYLRDAMGAGGTQTAMEQAIAAIQQEAAAAKATVFEGPSLTLDQHQAWLVWCSNAEGADFPTDTSDVFDKLRNGPGFVWIQVPFAPEVPVRSKDTFSNCNGGSGTFWAVAVR